MSLLDKIRDVLPLDKLPLGGSPDTQYYFALDITPNLVTAAVWEVAGGSLEILGQQTSSYEGTEDLIVKANHALDKSLGALEITPSKILFGVPDNWLLDENLKEPYSKLLQRMVKEYDLEPMAYVATSNAIAHLLQKKEGAPVGAILVGVDETVSVSLLKGGKVVGAHASKRVDDIFDNIEKALGGFNDEQMLPARILLYSISETQDRLERIKDHLQSSPWVQKLDFLHLPKIEVMPEALAIQGIVLAGAAEIDPGASFKLSMLPIGESGMGRMKRLPRSEDGGFVTGDIRKRREMVEQQDEQEAELRDDNLVATGGEGALLADSQLGRTRQEDVTEIFEPEPGGGKSGRILAALQAKIWRPIYRILPAPLKNLSGRNKPMVAGVAVLILLILGYLIFSRAEVTVFVEPKVLTNSAQVTADPKAQAVDEANNIIPGQVLQTSVSGSAKAQASGQKEIGDPAKGQVIIYNKTNASKSFSQGTALNGPNNLKFTLDSSVTVASQSAVDGGISFGKTTTGMTAAAIGPDSNLPAGTTMSFAGLSDTSYSAKVDAALSGGTSKKVTVVTDDDQKKLKAQVTDDLKRQAAGELQAKVQAGQKIIPEALSVTSSNFSFSKKVNDQATDFTVNANLNMRGTAYGDSDLKSIIGKLIETKVEDGFELNLAETETQADISKVEDDGRLVFLARFKAKLFPKLNQDEIKSKIRGRAVIEVSEIFKGMEGVLGAEVKLIPALPGPLARLPLLNQNITIKVTPK